MWKKVEANEKPLEVEDTIDGIFVRRNIETKTSKDEMNNKEITYYSYEENLFTANEYDMYQELSTTQEALQEMILMNLEGN